MKKALTAAIILTLLGLQAGALTTLYRIRFGHYPDKIRTVLDFDNAFTYHSDERKEEIVLRLKQVQAGPEIQSFQELNDLIIRYLQVEKEGEDLKVTIPLAEPVDYNVFYLNDPPRLVVDFSREYLNVVSGGTITDGVEYLKVTRGLADGRVTGNVLRIDLTKARVKPALAVRPTPNLLQSFLGLFSARPEPVSARRFHTGRVNEIVRDHHALAGVNGTYFAGNGKPLGALMIDQELISFSIHDRTALFLDDANRPFIDNIFLSAHFQTAKGTRYKITGLNQSRSGEEIIMYTPAWGERTGTNTSGLELVVSGRRVKEINLADSRIPEDGYVLSVSGPAVESLPENVKVGDELTTRISVVPYSASPDRIVQLVSGGPRLVKGGRAYVSKHEEKFKADIAQGRAARTAVGLTRQNELLLVTVDGLPRRTGRQRDPSASVGLTLEELSSLMLSLGAVEAMNLDGGGSSTMVVDGRVVNQPAGGYPRSVSNAIVVGGKF